MTLPTVIMLYRDTGDEHRSRAHRYSRDWWVNEVGWPVYVLDVPGPLWSRPAAFNLGARIAPDGVLVLANADVVLGSVEQAERAARLAEDTGVSVYPFTRYLELDAYGTGLLQAGMDWPQSSVVLRLDNSVGPLLFVTREAYRYAWGMDPRMDGWGFDDIAWSHQSATLLGPHQRVDGPCIHQYHPPDPTSYANSQHPSYQANMSLGARYEAASGDRVLMRALREEAGLDAGMSAVWS